jgi:outer membrane lipoprotein-sorting protein
MKKTIPESWEFGNLFKEPGLLQLTHQGMKTMDKHIRLFGILMIITCFLLMSGCTEQNKPSTKETIQIMLEKAAVIESVSYEINTTFIIDGIIPQITTMKIWQKTSYLKEEVNITSVNTNSTSGNITTTLTVIKRPDGLYRYDNISKTYQLDTQLILPQPSTTDMVRNLLGNQTLTSIGTENISGIPTTIIQYSPNQAVNTTTVTLWIWTEKGVPLKEQYTSNSQGTSVTINSIYSHYSFADIPESTFSVE